jgi:signal transduction histidine kinase
LSIARQAADLLGAKLWAESELGKGSAFHLDLPAQPPASATLDAATQTPTRR